MPSKHINQVSLMILMDVVLHSTTVLPSLDGESKVELNTGLSETPGEKPGVTKVTLELKSKEVKESAVSISNHSQPNIELTTSKLISLNFISHILL